MIAKKQFHNRFSRHFVLGEVDKCGFNSQSNGQESLLIKRFYPLDHGALQQCSYHI